MLVLSRKTNQEILINGNIKVSVLKVKGNVVRIGIEAPAEVSIKRGELVTQEIGLSNSESSEGADDSAASIYSADAESVKGSEQVSEEPAGFQLLPLPTDKSLQDSDPASLGYTIQTQFAETLQRRVCCDTVSCKQKSA